MAPLALYTDKPAFLRVFSGLLRLKITEIRLEKRAGLGFNALMRRQPARI